MSPPLSSLRRPRPFSISGSQIVSSSAYTTNCNATPRLTHIRRASLSPYMIGSSLYGSLSCSPPPPPTAQHIEQLDSIREQQYQFQQQLQMETHQKQRQQGELNEVLLKHRMALFEQRLISRWSNFTEERLEYRQRQIVRQALSQEYQQAAPTRVQMIENNASISREEYDLMLSPAQN